MASPTLSIATKLELAQICCYLCSNDTAKKSGLFGGSIKPQLPLLMRVVTDICQWQYDADPTDPTLFQTTNYLFDLCAPYQFQALDILGSVGGTTINPTPVGTLEFVRVQFTIPDASYMVAGDTQLIIADTGIYINTLQIIVDGVVLPIGVTGKLSYTYSQLLTTTTITFNDQAYTNQVYEYSYIKLVTA